MWILLILGQIVFANELDFAAQKATEAFLIQSGIKSNIETQIKTYKSLYVDKSMEKNIILMYSVGDIIINKRVGITYEF